MTKKRIKAGEIERKFDERFERHYWVNTLVEGRKFSSAGKAKMAYREMVAKADTEHWSDFNEQVLDVYQQMERCPKCNRELPYPVSDHLEFCKGFLELVDKKTRELWEKSYAEVENGGIE